MIELESGMRVRCVDDTGAADLLDKGREYTVEDVITIMGYVTLRFTEGWWAARRFKPVIRAKAKSEPHRG